MVKTPSRGSEKSNNMAQVPSLHNLQEALDRFSCDKFQEVEEEHLHKSRSRQNKRR
jgi:hypothetical protein